MDPDEIREPVHQVLEFFFLGLVLSLHPHNPLGRSLISHCIDIDVKRLWIFSLGTRFLRKKVGGNVIFTGIGTTVVGSSQVMKSVIQSLSKAAKCDKNVLLLGETGTGKDLAARKIHELSARAAHSFVAINCSNLSEAFFESELFGHTRGAFTGAVAEKAGLIEAAGNGTVFMDEIGEIPLHLQARILRLLDKKETRKIGATQTKSIKARFIFATNKDLRANVMEGSFRKDLYYRINILVIRIPPLRERMEDLPALVAHFVEVENARNVTRKSMTNEAMEKLKTHSFPGNIRELENIVERAFVFAENEMIRADDIQLEQDRSSREVAPMFDILQETLRQCRWNRTKAASRLGKSRRQFYRIMDKYKLVEHRIKRQC
jgi:transcriptional regulator with GAF, ATPase, and Fis domain